MLVFTVISHKKLTLAVSREQERARERHSTV